MLSDIKELSTLLKSNGYKVYQTNAPINIAYPYIIYEFVGTTNQNASNEFKREVVEYQISYITTGTAKELNNLKILLKNNGIKFGSFTSGVFDENDDTITQFNTYVRYVVEYD